MNDIDMVPPPPDGFSPSTGRGAFTSHNGPYFHRTTETGAQQAFFSLARHCNGVGLIHGGMLAAFLDGLLAGAVASATSAIPVTVQLSINFLGMGRAGEWVLGDASVTRSTRDIAFAEGRAHIAGRELARATGVFKLMRGVQR